MWEVQSMLFRKEQWNEQQALRYLYDHGIRPKKVDITRNWLRFRIQDPSGFRMMRTIHLNQEAGVRAIYGLIK